MFRNIKTCGLPQAFTVPSQNHAVSTQSYLKLRYFFFPGMVLLLRIVSPEQQLEIIQNMKRLKLCCREKEEP